MGLSNMLKINMDINKPKTHIKIHTRFLVNLDLGKTPSIFSRENPLESSSNLFIFQVQEKYICRQNKSTKYNLSLQPKTP